MTRPAALKSLSHAVLAGNGVFNLINVDFGDGQTSKDVANYLQDASNTVCRRHPVGSLQRCPAHWHVAYSWNERRHPRHHRSR